LRVVADLDPDIHDEPDICYLLDSGEGVSKAMRQPTLLAYLSVALTGQLVEAYLDREGGELAAELTEELWTALDCAYSTVMGDSMRASGGEGEGVSWRAAA
jgi:hypothetical protein